MVRSERDDRILVTKSPAALKARSASTDVGGMVETAGMVEAALYTFSRQEGFSPVVS